MAGSQPLTRTFSLVLCAAGLLHVGAADVNASANLKDARRADARGRLIVLTDIGGDPDDQQSMVRLMAFANEFVIEGLIATASGTPGELKRAITRPELIREIVEAYGRVLPSLRRHAEGYPAAEDLLARVKSGNPQRGWNHVGTGHDTEGSRWIIQVVDRPDPRPVNVAIWGGQTDLAQALWRVKADRGEAGCRDFARRLRIYDIGDQDRIVERIWKEFPGLFYILGQAMKGKDKREAVYRGMYLGGDESLTSRRWVDAHVRSGHGPLGALYPPRTWTAPNPHGTLKEGDTPSWFYFLDNGLNDPAHPAWGGWGGRFQKAPDGVWRDAQDTVGDVTHARASVWRWRRHFQNHFQARMDWCVKPRTEANHAPAAVCNGDATRRIIELVAARGAEVKLTAAGSSDPDGHRLSYRWWVYREAGTYAGEAKLSAAEGIESALAVPGDAAGKEIHVILEVTDDGTPPLTSCRRVVVKAQ
jgi:hypothetical protein